MRRFQVAGVRADETQQPAVQATHTDLVASCRIQKPPAWCFGMVLKSEAVWGLVGVSLMRSKRAGPLRYFIYVSDAKVQMLLDQIDVRVKRSIAAELEIDFKLLSIKLTRSGDDRSLRKSSQVAKLQVVEKYIRRHQAIGDLTARHGYFADDAELDWKPLDAETVLFCGYAEKLLVVLGGSVSNLIGRAPAKRQIGSHPSTIRAVINKGSGQFPGDLGRDLQAAAGAILESPQPVRFLARAISRGALPADSADAEYLLGTPLYVEAVDMINP